VDRDHVLRTHTTAHLPTLLADHERFLVTGDVYRREPIDRTHYPVFHQMEGVKVTADPEADLRDTIDRLLGSLLPRCRRLVTESHFTYAEPSFEVQVEFGGRWLEVLGGGVVRPEVMDRAGRPGQSAWAFGLGLDRLAMAMMGVPDIGMLWEWV
jgi:phenylalanyl-tRNA synthetase alpha chain